MQNECAVSFLFFFFNYCCYGSLLKCFCCTTAQAEPSQKIQVQEMTRLSPKDRPCLIYALLSYDVTLHVRNSTRRYF